MNKVQAGARWRQCMGARALTTPAAILAAVLAAAVAAAVAAAPGDAAAQTAGGPAQPPAIYRPGLGDLMTMTVQPRHVKLAAAGREQNWTYAAYELHELGEAFDRVAKAWPIYRGFPVPDMIASVIRPPISALDDAVKAQDQRRYTEAYGQLTDACNACHQATNRPMVVIRVPAEISFPDQDFRSLPP